MEHYGTTWSILHVIEQAQKIIIRRSKFREVNPSTLGRVRFSGKIGTTQPCCVGAGVSPLPASSHVCLGRPPPDLPSPPRHSPSAYFPVVAYHNARQSQSGFPPAHRPLGNLCYGTRAIGKCDSHMPPRNYNYSLCNAGPCMHDARVCGSTQW